MSGAGRREGPRAEGSHFLQKPARAYSLFRNKVSLLRHFKFPVLSHREFSHNHLIFWPNHARRPATDAPNSRNSLLNSLITGNSNPETGSLLTASSATQFSLRIVFSPERGKRPRSRRLGCPAPVSGQQFAAFRYFGRGFRAPVSARYFPISVSGEGRLVRVLAETSSTRDRVKLLRPVNQKHRN